MEIESNTGEWHSIKIGLVVKLRFEEK